jgi:hypothetical protein
MAEPVLTPPGRIARWRLAEPVAFYLAVPFLALVCWFLAAALAGEWAWAAGFAVEAGVLYAAGLAVRASVYSEPTHFTECRDTALRVARGELIP